MLVPNKVDAFQYSGSKNVTSKMPLGVGELGGIQDTTITKPILPKHKVCKNYSSKTRFVHPRATSTQDGFVIEREGFVTRERGFCDRVFKPNAAWYKR